MHMWQLVAASNTHRVALGRGAVPVDKEVFLTGLPLGKVMRIAYQLHFDVPEERRVVFAHRRPLEAELVFSPQVFIGIIITGREGQAGGYLVD